MRYKILFIFVFILVQGYSQYDTAISRVFFFEAGKKITGVFKNNNIKVNIIPLNTNVDIKLLLPLPKKIVKFMVGNLLELDSNKLCAMKKAIAFSLEIDDLNMKRDSSLLNTYESFGTIRVTSIIGCLSNSILKGKVKFSEYYFCIYIEADENNWFFLKFEHEKVGLLCSNKNCNEFIYDNVKVYKKFKLYLASKKNVVDLLQDGINPWRFSELPIIIREVLQFDRETEY